MRVTFIRLPDHQRGWALVERDDGVTYRLSGGPVSAELPHDLVHFTAERALRMADGIWGAIAGGVVFHSMTHQSGRRPPHAAELSAELIRTNRDRIQLAELLGGFVERIAALPEPTTINVARLAKTHLATLPPADVDLIAAVSAAAELSEMAEVWRALPVGEHLTVDWPGWLRMQVRSGPPDGRGTRHRAGTRGRASRRAA